jgi:hypothetical protein
VGVRQGCPWLFVVTHDALEPGTDAAAVLDACGFAPIIPLTGMIARSVAPLSNVPSGLRLEVAEDDAACCDAIDVNSAAYGMDLNASKPALGRGALWADHLLVVGRAGGAPATSARGHAGRRPTATWRSWPRSQDNRKRASPKRPCGTL